MRRLYSNGTWTGQSDTRSFSTASDKELSITGGKGEWRTISRWWEIRGTIHRQPPDLGQYPSGSKYWI